MMNSYSRNKFPFTPSQWQELEHQALIFKYMASGIPIPPDLLFPIRRSYLDSPLSSSLLSHQPHQHFGWNKYLQMGLGRKIDPEPGRCRRTDGKKWRCSKEAYPDSKYCERHMHRGKNRSRKPVEVLKTKTSPPLPPTPTPTPTTSSFYPIIPSTFLYHPPPPSTSFQDTAPFFLDSHTNSDIRYAYEVKGEVDEHAFFTEPSGSMSSRNLSASSMDDSSWHFTPLSKKSNSDYSSNYLQLQSTKQAEPEPEAEQDHDQACYILKCETETPLKLPQNHKIVHRFFDEWPPKSRDLYDKSSTTQLSISTPASAHHFPTHQDGDG